MDERMSFERLEASLRALEPAFPQTPSSMTSSVTARLRGAGARRPLFAATAHWSRRRVIVLVTAVMLAALAVAAVARYAIGAFEVRVQPGAVPSPSTPAFEPDVLGDPVPAAVAEAEAGFGAQLPAGPPPDETYVIDSLFGDPGQVFAWRPSATYPAIEGTDWGLVLVAAQGDAELVVKAIDRFEDLHEVLVDGRRAFWIPVPHTLLLETERGVQTLAVRGNVLIWQGGGGVAYRLETALGRAEAIALAESAA